MFIKKLPSDERSLILASSSINTYKKAVEELVYNALDAESTSFAIRVNIEQNSIQVIDNGCGITKKDLVLTGQRYMTSKHAEKSNKYGYRGETLANIVDISRIVKIISRHESSDESWEKCFKHGRTENILEIVKRPSKGTTIEIKGLLYNLKIQNQSMIPLNELQEIKIFLERISLVHNNISLSLRDDFKNEIIFQIHKKRDIYQTLSSLYGIDRIEIQELKVEKNQYAVTAYISKEIRDISKHWIFLNRKFVKSTSKLHKIVNDNLHKSLKNEYHRKKAKIMYDDEDMFLIKNKLPFYFLFIQCPITDYDIICNHVNFNNWDQITKLLGKFVKFYLNDVSLKTVTNNKTRLENKKINEDTREQVKEIMYKIIAADRNILGFSQMQNGIKGKITKRKHTKKRKTQIISQNKLTTTTTKSNTHIDLTTKNNLQPSTIRKSNKRKIDKRVCEENNKNKIAHSNLDRKTKFKKSDRFKDLKLKVNIPGDSKKKSHIGLKTKASKKGITEFINDPVIRKFINPTASIKSRCDILAKKAQEVLNNWNMGRSATYVDKSIQYSCVKEQYKGFKTGRNAEFINQYGQINLRQTKKTEHAIEEKLVKSSYDLLKTLMNTQTINNEVNTNRQSFVCYDKQFTDYEYKSKYSMTKELNEGQIMSKLTYESHDYEVLRSRNQKLNKPINIHYMPKKCKDNFVTSKFNSLCSPKICEKSYAYNRNLKGRKYNIFTNQTFDDCSARQKIEEFSQLIELPKSSLIQDNNNTIEEVNTFISNFTLSNYRTNNLSLFIKNTYQNIRHNKEFIHDKTYSLPRVQPLNNEQTMFLENSLYINAVSHYNIRNSDINTEKSNFLFSTGSIGTSNNKKNVPKAVFIPDSQNSSKSQTPNSNYAPIDICEAVFLSRDLFEKEFEISFNSNNRENVLKIDANENAILCDVYKDTITYNSPKNTENASHHFNNINNITNNLISNIERDEMVMSRPVADKEKTITDTVTENLDNNHRNDNEKFKQINLNSFDLKNRLHFVPKGMSPIFKNCNTKQACDYKHDLDYYQDSLYHDFINEVHVNSEIYNEQLEYDQNKNKCKSKKHDDFSLHFDGQSLKYAKILNQVDNKFIAAIIKAKAINDEDSTNFLAFFDQHAVHERIRLENNMSEYFADGQWKSISVDCITILLPKDEILYLHNYKEKFAQLGLQWLMSSSDEIQITAIPEAILGKNPRQVDKIMKVVKNLISGQISNIRSQNGCISVYPKSIMDLIFSEACRYAVMFGDNLSKEYCEELLQALSKCKNPFQCAHGRPVMAILTDFKYNKQEYKANLTKLKYFKE